jgi:hypothetical protein
MARCQLAIPTLATIYNPGTDTLIFSQTSFSQTSGNYYHGWDQALRTASAGNVFRDQRSCIVGAFVTPLKRTRN